MYQIINFDQINSTNNLSILICTSDEFKKLKNMSLSKISHIFAVYVKTCQIFIVIKSRQFNQMTTMYGYKELTNAMKVSDYRPPELKKIILDSSNPHDDIVNQTQLSFIFNISLDDIITTHIYSYGSTKYNKSNDYLSIKDIYNRYIRIDDESEEEHDEINNQHNESEEEHDEFNNQHNEFKDDFLISLFKPVLISVLSSISLNTNSSSVKATCKFLIDSIQNKSLLDNLFELYKQTYNTALDSKINNDYLNNISRLMDFYKTLLIEYYTFRLNEEDEMNKDEMNCCE